MALDAIGREVGNDSKLEADSGGGRIRKCGHSVESAEGLAEVTRVADCAQLVLGAARVIKVAVELGGFETQRKTGERSMAGKTLTAAGIVPNLRPDGTLVVDGKGFVQAFRRNE